MKDGGPAFPTVTYLSPHLTADNVVAYNVDSACGLSMRDWFAGQALVGMLPTEADGLMSIQTAVRMVHEAHIQRLADQAFAVADAMLKAREP